MHFRLRAEFNSIHNVFFQRRDHWTLNPLQFRLETENCLYLPIKLNRNAIYHNSLFGFRMPICYQRFLSYFIGVFLREISAAHMLHFYGSIRRHKAFVIHQSEQCNFFVCWKSFKWSHSLIYLLLFQIHESQRQREEKTWRQFAALI